MTGSTSSAAMPTPGAPIFLATELLHLEEAQVAAANAEMSRTVQAVRTGVKAIDEEALAGRGFERGKITAVSGGAGTGKTVIALHAMVTHLLERPEARAAIIDTTNAFSPLRLHDLVLARLRRGESDERPALQAQAAEEDREVVVMSLLDRVSISSVFDLHGVVEAVAELRDSMEGKQRQTQKSRAHAPSPIAVDEDEPAEQEIADSQDEGMDLDESTSSTSRRHEQVELEKEEADPGSEAGPPRSNVDIIVIDNITNVVSSLVRRNHVQGHALLASFIRSLSLLTSRHSIVTILLNSAVQTRQPPPDAHRSSTITSLEDGPKESRADPSRAANEHVSVFASTLGKPALGKIFMSCADTHVFVSRVPRTMADAERAYSGGRSDEDERGGDQVARSHRPAGGRDVGVFEIIAERSGDRVGRWGCFDIDAGELR